MADIREILNALSPDDRAMYTQHRNEMRRSYLLAHTETIGMDKWGNEDDRLLDYIDISLALLYDRAGRLVASKEIIGDDKANIEMAIDTADANLKKIDNATKLINPGWPSNGAFK
jgi:hypothetical protein